VGRVATVLVEAAHELIILHGEGILFDLWTLHCCAERAAPGVHPKVVQERLGHANIAITMDTHSHVLPTLQEGAARRLDGFLDAI
jgi:hypothetical protein